MYYANVGRSVRDKSSFHQVTHTHRSLNESKCGQQGLTQHVLFCRNSTNCIHWSEGPHCMRTWIGRYTNRAWSCVYIEATCSFDLQGWLSECKRNHTYLCETYIRSNASVALTKTARRKIQKNKTWTNIQTMLPEERDKHCIVHNI